MELNRKQIIKALEHCTSGKGCDSCPLSKTLSAIEDCNINGLSFSFIKAQAEDYTELDEKYRMLYEENERLQATRYFLHSDGRMEMIPTVDAVRDSAVRDVLLKFSLHFGTYTDEDTVKVVDVFKLLAQIEKEVLEGTK